VAICGRVCGFTIVASGCRRSGPDLEEQVLVRLVFLLDVVVADLQSVQSAVRPQRIALATRGAKSRPFWRAADQEDLRLRFLISSMATRAYGRVRVQGQLFVVGEDHAVGAVGDDVLRQSVHVCARRGTRRPRPRACPQLARLADQLEADVGDLVIGMLDEYQMFLCSVMSGLPDDVFVDQLRNHRRDSFGVGGDGLALRAPEDHEVDLVNLGRGAGQADAAFGSADVPRPTRRGSSDRAW